MKRYYLVLVKISIINLILLLVSLTFFAQVTFAQKPFQIVYDNVDCYISSEKNGKTTGLIVDILKELLTKRLDIPLEFKRLPWKRALLQVEKGSSDGFAGGETKARSVFAIPSKENLITMDVVAFIRSNHPKRSEMDKFIHFKDFKNYKILDTRGNVLAEKLLIPLGLKVDTGAGTVDAAFKKLAKRRGDIYFFEIYSGIAHVKKAELTNQVVRLSNSYYSLPIKLYVSKKSHYADRISMFDKVIYQMKEDGTISKILSKPIDSL